MKFLISSKAPEERIIENLKRKYDFSIQEVNTCFLLKEKDTVLETYPGISGLIDGYMRNFDFEASDISTQLKNSLHFISKNWPVGDSITGSFSSVIIDDKNELVLCNDSIGIYPLYYYAEENKFIISNSLIWIGAISKAAFDEVGLFQRAYCPEFSNIGSRTLLKNVKRLLPGEWIKFTKSGKLLERKFDNELYNKVDHSASPEIYWEAFKKELAYCVADEDKIHIGLSGGMDSRLIMCGLPEDKKLFCHTYGKKDFYETKIARRVAKLYNAEFKNYSYPEFYIPNKELLEKYTLETEAIYINSWLEILEDQELLEKDMMLLGDMTESLQGRNLPVKKDLQNFRKYYVKNDDYEFQENNGTTFNNWKKEVIKYFSALISKNHIEHLNLNISEELLIAEIIKDSEEIIKRVKDHNLPYMELVKELFAWLTHSRTPMGKQILIMNSKFKCCCVPMNIQILRLTSNINPNLRINGRFIKTLFTSVEELNAAASIPTSQIPFVPFNAPDFLKIPIWYLRSKIDDYLIKRMMKFRNPKKRYRLLKSFNWAEIYQHPCMESNLKSAFAENNLGNYSYSVIGGALARKEFKQWPLSNVNIVNAMALNTEISLLKEIIRE